MVYEDLGSGQAKVVTSGSKAYHLQGSSASSSLSILGNKCSSNGGVCQVFKTYTQLGLMPCESRFICTRLTNDICGNYGIILQYSHINGSSSSSTQTGPGINLCQTGRVIGMTMNHLSQLQLELWFTPNAKFEVQCHFWCTKDGDIPAKAILPGGGGDNPANLTIQQSATNQVPVGLQGLLSQMASLGKVEEVGLQWPDMQAANPEVTSLSSTKPVSSDTVYYLNVFKPASNPNDLGLKTSVMNFRPQQMPCQATFVCMSLEGNVCGDYGLVINSTTEVCRPRQYVRASLSASSPELTVSLWYTPASAFKASCFFWCTANGSAPRPTSGSTSGNSSLVPLSPGASGILLPNWVSTSVSFLMVVMEILFKNAQSFDFA